SDAICNTAFGESYRESAVTAIMGGRNEITRDALEYRVDRSALNIQIASWWPPCDDIVNSREIFTTAELVRGFAKKDDRVAFICKCCAGRMRHVAQQSYHSDDGRRINGAGRTFII